MKKIKLLLLPALVAILLFSTVMLFNGKISYVNANSSTVDTYTVLEAGSIRQVAPTGIRFRTEISDTKKSSFGADAEFGVIIVPEEMLNGELSHDTNSVVEIPTRVWIDSYNKQGYSAFNSVLAGQENEFPEEFYNVPLAVRGYVKYGVSNSEIAYSENTIVRSITYVAKVDMISGGGNGIVTNIASKATEELIIGNEPTTYSYGDTKNYDLTLKIGGVIVKNDDSVSIEFSSDNESVIDIKDSTLSIVGAGSTTIKATVTSKKYSGEGNSFVVSKEINVNKKTTTLKEKELFDKYVANGTYTINTTTLDGEFENATFTDQNNAENIVTSDNVNIDENLLATGYYNLKIETNNVIYSGVAVVADKVINTKDELKNWPYYIRPANWANNVAVNYDGFVVLGDNIDYGGSEYLNELMAALVTNQTEGFVEVYKDSNNVKFHPNTETPTGELQTTNGYVPKFVGTFDGLGYCIHNINFSYNGTGLFGTYLPGTVKNLAVANAKLTGYRKGIFSYDFSGTIENIFLEGVLNVKNQNTGLLAGKTSGTPKMKRVAAVLSEGVNRSDSGVLIGRSTTINVDSTLVNSIYGIGNVGLFTLEGNEITNILRSYRATSLQDFIGANNDINSFGAEYWSAESGFLVMHSATGKFTKINLQAKNDSDNVVNTVAAGSSVNIGIKKYMEDTSSNTYTNNQSGFSEIKLANNIDGVTFENGVLFVSSSVASGTNIKLVVTNKLDKSTNALTLTVA